MTGGAAHVPPGGRIVFESRSERGSPRGVAVEASGFIHEYRFRPRIRQFGPRVSPGGVAPPTAHLDINSRVEALDSLWVTVVEDAEVRARPGPGAFVVAAPAGTLVLDHREDRENPRQGMARYPVVDVRSYADRLSPSSRSIEPVLEPGQPAPPIEPAAWLDRDGTADAPELTGKVVLVDFWGIGCGPCVAQLPAVQAAADHFRGTDLVLIGPHDGDGTVEQVAEFARKRGLTYPLAIDRPAGAPGWFGATSRAYGVRAIPHAAVIDRRGRIALVGRFAEALAKAAELLKEGP